MKSIVVEDFREQLDGDLVKNAQHRVRHKRLIADICLTSHSPSDAATPPDVSIVSILQVGCDKR
jgi:hypothetical protein